MVFDKSFFKGEEIDNFFVDSTMKRYWAASIETLEEIDKVCKKHGITWYADGGTLLGTVRHRGFVPWDDDMDIAMKRSDYELFLQIAQSELPEHYMVLNSDSEKYWVNNAASVSNWDEDQYVTLETCRLVKYHGCPFPIGIDVFPLDYMYRDKQQEELRDRLLMGIWYAIAAIDQELGENQIRQRVYTIETVAQFKLPDWNGDYKVLKRELRHFSDTVMQLCPEEEADELAELRWFLLGEYPEARFRKEWYKEVIYMPFHGFQMPVPREYDKILKGTYGDYMTPVQGTASHSYPKFKNWLAFLENWRKETGESRSLEQIITDLMGQ